MIMDMYAIKDELNGYTVPIPFMSEEIAKRYLKDQYMGNPTIKNSAEDFSLWKIGTFNSESGTFIMTPNGLELVERAKNYAN